MKALAALLLCPVVALAAEPWSVIGRQGLVQFVVVPQAVLADADAYQEQLALLCRPETTCFVNFYANPANEPLALPLPDTVEHQATARFRRSMKNGAQTLQWACRVKPGEQGCF